MKALLPTAAILMALQMLAPPAHAAGGILYRTTTSGLGFSSFFRITQSPGITWTFTTSNLTAGGDTVLHVQNDSDPQAPFVAGDDDGNGGFASRAIVPPASSTRTLVIVVRSFSFASSGTCTFTASPSSGLGGFSNAGVPFSGAGQSVGNLAAGSHIQTAEVQGGVNDTVLLAVRDGGGVAGTHAVGFDDDDGVGNMSFIHLNEACTLCWIFVGAFLPGSDAPANVAWDENADTTDFDNDGLGQSLESFLTTKSTNDANPPGVPPDTSGTDFDQDGIPDGVEIYGLDGSSPVKFPFMGADPRTKDLFAELDWVDCTDPTCLGNRDASQLGWVATPSQIIPNTEFIVNQIEATFAPVAVHLDIGRANTNPNSWFNWGDWGGAGRTAAVAFDGQNANPCVAHSPQRERLFHFGVTIFPQGGSTPNPLPQPCSIMSNASGTDPIVAGETFTHETGHQLGLGHGGRPFAIDVNGKPNYRSVMNYIYKSTFHGFSIGDSPVVQFNPASMSESVGVGLVPGTGMPDPNVVSVLKSRWCPGGSCVNATTGAVDWDRDGAFSGTGATVRAEAVEKIFGQFFPQSFGTQWSGVQSLDKLSASWVSVGGAVGDQLWIVGRGFQGEMQYIRVPRSSLDSGCNGLRPSFTEASPFADCAGAHSTAPVSVSGNIPLFYGAGVAGDNGKIYLFYQPTSGGHVRVAILTINPTSGLVTTTSATMPGNIDAAGDVTALTISPGVINIWVPVSNGRLKQWVMTNGVVTNPVDQSWSSGSGGGFVSMNTGMGIGTAIGYEAGGTAQTYAAIPTSPSNSIEFARRAADGTWTKISSIWTRLGTQPFASGRPGLAYQHKAGQANSVGRFYMAFNQVACSGPYGAVPCNQMLLMTEGNATATPQQLQWVTPTSTLGGTSASGIQGIALIDDLTRDTNLRAVTVQNAQPQIPTQVTWLAPFADGIMNANLRDIDDTVYVRGLLRASLSLDCLPNNCTFPATMFPASLP